MLTIKESFLNPRTSQTAPPAIKGFSAGSSLTDQDDDRSYVDKMKDDATEAATGVAKRLDLSPEPAKAPEPKAPEMQFSTNRAVQAVDQAAKIKLAAEGIDVDSLPWEVRDKEHAHHQRVHCIKCGTVNTCRCSAAKKNVKGICFTCKQEEDGKDEPAKKASNSHREDQATKIKLAFLLKRAETTETWNTGAPKLDITPAQAAKPPVNTLTSGPSPTSTVSAPAPAPAAQIPPASSPPAPRPAPAVQPAPRVARRYSDLVYMLGRAPTSSEQRAFYQMGSAGQLNDLRDPATIQAFRAKNQDIMRQDSAFTREYGQGPAPGAGILETMAYDATGGGDGTQRSVIREKLNDPSLQWNLFGNDTGLGRFGNGMINLVNPWAVAGTLGNSYLDMADQQALASSAWDRGEGWNAVGHAGKALAAGLNGAVSLAGPLSAGNVMSGMATKLAPTAVGAAERLATGAGGLVTRAAEGAGARIGAAAAKIPGVVPTARAVGGAARGTANVVSGIGKGFAEAFPKTTNWMGNVNQLGYQGPGIWSSAQIAAPLSLGQVASGFDREGDAALHYGDYLEGQRNPNDGRMHSTMDDVWRNAGLGAAQIGLGATMLPGATAAGSLGGTVGEKLLGGKLGQIAGAAAEGKGIMSAEHAGEAADAHDATRKAVNDYNQYGAAFGVTHDDAGQRLPVDQVAKNLDSITTKAKNLGASPKIIAQLDTATAKAKEEVANGETDGWGMQLLMMLVSNMFGGGGMFGQGGMLSGLMGGGQPQPSYAMAPSTKAFNTTLY